MQQGQIYVNSISLVWCTSTASLLAVVQSLLHVAGAYTRNAVLLLEELILSLFFFGKNPKCYYKYCHSFVPITVLQWPLQACIIRGHAP